MSTMDEFEQALDAYQGSISTLCAASEVELDDVKICEYETAVCKARAHVIALHRAAQQDAERYRTVRDYGWIKLQRETMMFLSANAFDGVVDAARSAKT